MQFQCPFVCEVLQIVVVYTLTFSFNMVVDNLHNRPTFDRDKKKKLPFSREFQLKNGNFFRA